MCGIAGIYLNECLRDEQIAGASRVIERMTASLALRGPDGSGHWVHSHIAFGHRRLSILDLSDLGAQPMRFNERGLTITYNGEVYNFLELKRELKALGCVFRGNSDTEVVLMAYAKWGVAGLKRIEGIFALALWDAKEQRLVLMRDRFGVKPLFYGESAWGLAFGSEIKAVLLAGGVDTSRDDQSLSEYLWYGNTFGDRTFYKGVRAIEPGYWMIVEQGIRKIEPWWKIEEWLEQPGDYKNFGDAADQVRTALDQSVARQLVADVPVGIFLSGGIDSSAIAAAAMQNRDSPLHSYSVGFEYDRGRNELPKAELVAKYLGLTHHELHVSGFQLEDVLLELARAHDEPFADAANIPLYLMCRQLGGEMKVVLQGDGGDELFGGYRRYSLLQNAKWWNWCPKILSRMIRQFGSYGRRISRVADSVGNSDSAMRMALLLTMETNFLPPERVFSQDRQRQLRNETNPFMVYLNAAERFRNHNPVQQMLLTDLTVQLPGQFLPKVDRASMAAGIEARVPLLDERTAKLAIGIPAEWKTKGLEKKVVLRESQRCRLPRVILDGPKTGFGVPYDHWLRTTLQSFAKQHLFNPDFLQSWGIDRRSVESIMSEHVRNLQSGQGFLLWKLLQLAINTAHVLPLERQRMTC